MLTKETKITRREILEDGQIQVRETTRVLENGVIISETHHRRVVQPDADLTNEDPKITELTNIIWTQQVKDDFIAAKEAREANHGTRTYS